IYYGQGNWPGLRADKLRNEVLIPVCSPLLLNGPKPLIQPSDLKLHTLLHDSSRQDWQAWFRQCGVTDINVNQGPIFSHS
ncbi:LysR substrate-binding domain-containing protein, partial [Psychrobacter sp. CAL495-MNA-CIBAN-0180]